MANIKSAEKRARQAVGRTARNRSVLTRLRSAVKKYRNTEDKAAAVSATHSEIDVARKKGVIHKNAAARYKSRLARKAANKT